jgi:signal transduction histidine kinase
MKKTLKTAQNYPVFSALFSIILVAYLLLLVLKTEFSTYPFLISVTQFFNDYQFLTHAQFILSIVALFLLILTWDVQRFYRMRKVVKHNSNKLSKEIEDLWESKKHLQNKAHTYSGHADKLKLFISDKLLEYIEYDEKFLHFKSIAAEVRHNGVISYDIVTTLLEQLIAQDGENKISAQHSLDSMRYLWDLLDLSTADNIALHIANQLINAEEQYYQMMLEKENAEGEGTSGLLQADFSSLQAILSTLLHLVHDPEEVKLASDKIDIDATNDATIDIDASLTENLQSCWEFNDDQFTVQLNANKALLGNANHVRLVLENLLKNAQHFSRKVSFKQKSDRILLVAEEGEGCLEFQVYNRGPQILEENKQKLFQLGYSTRRTKEHHGKGLGLFFVNEIIKGYEGQLLIENVDNQSDSYSVRIGFKNGKVETKLVNVEIIDHRPYIIDDSSNNENTVRWSYPGAIESIEISSNTMNETCRFSSDEGSYKKSESYLQPLTLSPQGVVPPCWALDVQAKRGGNKSHNVIFNVLDISGVRFRIKLPTAEARLEGIEPSWLE